MTSNTEERFLHFSFCTNVLLSWNECTFRNLMWYSSDMIFIWIYFLYWVYQVFIDFYDECIRTETWEGFMGIHIYSKVLIYSVGLHEQVYESFTLQCITTDWRLIEGSDKNLQRNLPTYLSAKKLAFIQVVRYHKRQAQSFL